MKKKKNIMFLIGKMTNGGAERVVKNLCNNLRDEYNVTLVVKTMKNADYVPEGINIIEMDDLADIKKIPIALYKLRKLKKDLKIDTCISFLTPYAIYNNFSKYKEKTVTSVRNIVSQNLKEKGRIKFFFYGWALRKVDLVVNVSKLAMQDSINYFKSPASKNITIPNFCDTKEVDRLKVVELDDDLKKIFDGRVVISVGRYAMQKGHWHLIRAFKKVVEHNKNAKLVLVGKGVYKDYYLELIRDLHLEKNVFVLDYTNNVFRLMYNSDLHILTSFHEGMPNVVIEALACGIPNIATDSPGGSKEILDPKNVYEPFVKDISLGEYGILIPKCDRNEYKASDPLTYEEEKIAESIIMLLDDKKLYDRYKKASEKRIKDFTKEKGIQKWKDII